MTIVAFIGLMSLAAPVVPATQPAAEISAVDRAAEDAGREFMRRLAETFREQSDKADETKSYADAFDFVLVNVVDIVWREFCIAIHASIEAPHFEIKVHKLLHDTFGFT